MGRVDVRVNSEVSVKPEEDVEVVKKDLQVTVTMEVTIGVDKKTLL